ncbi:hypothetical protein HJC23_007098 [Cyclotella cryptica]|uniref:Uncharacterized protein n=1 Tax=Cyclotella cryptica TaxID=29204 RepID=A0ABD3P257_9STRA|eukprot:CCRYP_018353-RB/>CCRYP_018353-RB protein AED:0.18 eAED:0.18 QI:491/1/1/1/0.75/0.6/5/2655/844
MTLPKHYAVLFVILLCRICKSDSRELQLNCPKDEFNDGGTVQEKFEGRFDAYSIGSTWREVVRKLRPNPESYYHNVINQVIMFVCDVESASERCVEADSPFAAKDWAGYCINATDYKCPKGMCERSSNCYWNTVVEGKNRTMRFPVEAYNKAEAALMERTPNSYAGEIALFGLIGAAVSMILLLIWLVFFVGRFFCCCLWSKGFCYLCSPVPKQKGYRTFQDIILPVIFYIIALVAIAAATSMAFLGNEDINVATSNAFIHADGLVIDLTRFLGRSRIPLENVQDIVAVAALDAKSIFDGTDFVKRDALHIVDSFLGFYSLHSEGLNASNTLAGFYSATSGFEEKVTPITDNVQSLLDTLEIDLYDKADLIKVGLITAMGQLDSLSQQSLHWQGEIYNYEGTELGFRDMRRLAVMATFLLSASFAILGFFGVILSKTKLCSVCFYMVTITAFFCAIIGTFALTVASIGLSVNFLLHDACEISDIITKDFEPFVGDLVAPAANAAFNDTNLAQALNLTDKVDFQKKLDDGISQIEEINVTANFDRVLDPLSEIQSMLGTISGKTLSILNQVTSSDEFPCAFGDVEYTKESVLFPWSASRPTENTSYVIRDNFGGPTSYDRLGLESAEDYMSRIYNIAGICSTPSDCCIYQNPMTTCESEKYASCDFGDGCVYPCSSVRTAIAQGYNTFLQLYEKELKVTADLGVYCPTTGYNGTCPTAEFKSQHSNLTLVRSIQDYKVKILAMKESMLQLASTSVGDTMYEVEDFLCNMNVSFVNVRYDELNDDVCGKLFGGLAQIDGAFWVLGVTLEIVATICYILSIRLKRSYDKDNLDILDSNNGLRRINLY